MKTVPLQLKRDVNTKQMPVRLGDASREHLAAIIEHRSKVEFGYRGSTTAVLRVPTAALVIQQLLEEEYNRIKGN